MKEKILMEKTRKKKLKKASKDEIRKEKNKYKRMRKEYEKTINQGNMYISFIWCILENFLQSSILFLSHVKNLYPML